MYIYVRIVLYDKCYKGAGSRKQEVENREERSGAGQNRVYSHMYYPGPDGSNHYILSDTAQPLMVLRIKPIIRV